MREIKFRFWLTNQHKMATWEQCKKECDRLSLFTMDGFIPMQYTGLVDKNEKEVYDGDIVKSDGGLTLQIAWSQDTQISTVGFILKNQFGFVSALTPSTGSILEVIGNIYQNPELINQ